MAIRTYISIITLNVNGLNAPTKTGRMDTKTRPIYMLSSRDPLQFQGNIQIESERMEENIPCKQGSKESWSCNTQSDKLDIKMKNILREIKDIT